MISVEKWMLEFVEKPKAKTPEPAPVVAPTHAPAVVNAPAPRAPAPTTTTPMPASNTPSPAPSMTTEKLVFRDLILPIFEAKCNKCHNEDKSKGDLRLDTYEMAMQGGENGRNFVAGKPDESLSIQRIALPVDDDEHMPPDGKEQLTPAEFALLRYWVQAGASATQKISEAQFPPEAKEALSN
jgi:hypothetical protein